MKEKLNSNTGMLALFAAVLLLIQVFFLGVSLYAGRAGLYLRVVIPVWVCIIFLYGLAIWLTKNAQTKEFSFAVALIVIFSGFLMTIGSLTQVLLIDEEAARKNAAKYILYEVYSYSEGQECTNVLHSSEGSYNIADLFTEEETKTLISSLKESGLTLQYTKKEKISDENPLKDGETADEDGYVTRTYDVDRNYRITGSEALKSIKLLTDNESFPEYNSILEKEYNIRLVKSTRSLTVNYLEALAGGIILLLLLLFMHGHYYDYWVFFLAGFEIFIFAALLLFGSGTDGAKINLGPFQPLEFMKLVYVFVLAALLCKPEKAGCGFKLPIPGKNGTKYLKISRYAAAILFIGVNAFGFMACGEMGTLLVIGCVGLFMIWIFCEDIRYRLGLLAAAGLAVLALAVMTMTKFTYLGVKLYNRVHYFLHPEDDAAKLGYQYIQLRESLSVSGWFGAKERYSFSISQQKNDMVFAILVQHRGVFYGILVILVFIGLLMVCYRSALRAQDIYYRGLGLGCCLILGVQGLIHISYNVGVFPITGVPLMYISDGGSNMAVSMMFSVLLIMISSNHLQRAVSDEEEVEQLEPGFGKHFIEVVKHSFSAGWF